jgi:hypothetical protein
VCVAFIESINLYQKPCVSGTDFVLCKNAGFFFFGICVGFFNFAVQEQAWLCIVELNVLLTI